MTSAEMPLGRALAQTLAGRRSCVEARWMAGSAAVFALDALSGLTKYYCPPLALPVILLPGVNEVLIPAH